MRKTLGGGFQKLDLSRIALSAREKLGLRQGLFYIPCAHIGKLGTVDFHAPSIVVGEIMARCACGRDAEGGPRDYPGSCKRCGWHQRHRAKAARKVERAGEKLK